MSAHIKFYLLLQTTNSLAIVVGDRVLVNYEDTQFPGEVIAAIENDFQVNSCIVLEYLFGSGLLRTIKLSICAKKL